MTEETKDPRIAFSECDCENPYGRGCSCNSMSIEPCSYCDWYMGHDTDDCEYDYCTECCEPLEDRDTCPCWEDEDVA